MLPLFFSDSFVYSLLTDDLVSVMGSVACASCAQLNDVLVSDLLACDNEQHTN